MTEEWKKMNASPEKFLKAEQFITKPFSGILEAIYPSETKGEKPTPLIRLDFEGGSSLSIFGLDKQNDDGTYPFALGSFIKSAEALGLEVQAAEDEGIVQGIQITKDGVPLEKPTVWIRGIEDKTVGDDSQTKSYFKWGILEKYEVTAPAAPKKPGKYPAKPKTKEQPAPQTDITGIVLDALPEPRSVSELFTALGKKYKVSELRVALDSLKAQGIVVERAGKYEVV